MGRTIRAARLVEHGKPLQVEQIELPEPGRDEVLVELEFAGVNPVDRYNAQGSVAADGPLPRTLGGEAVGRRDGQLVLVAGGGLGSRRDGVWAEAAVVPERTVLPLPYGVDPQAAAALGVAGLTAYKVVVELGEVGPDDRVLVLGASGGVGLAIVSLAASTGARVVGQTGSAEKASVIREFGAADAVVADASGLAAAAGDLRPTVVIDALGGPFIAAAIPLLAVGGRVVVYGTSADAEATLNWQLVYRNGLTIHGYAGLQLSNEERRAGLEQAMQELAGGRMRIRVDRVVPLEQVNEAFDAIADRQVAGKVLLRCGGG